MNYSHILKRMWVLLFLLSAMPSFCHATGVDLLEADARTEKVTVKKDYQREVIDSEKKIIAYVIHTLATASEFKLLGLRSDLNKTGKKIDHIHPLRQLLCVFTDPSIRSDFHKMSRRYLVWKNYAEKLTDVLSLEADKGNLTRLQIENFANTLSIASEPACSFLEKRKWRAFLDWLLTATR